MHERANFGQLEQQMQYQRAELEQQLYAVSGVSNDRIEFLRSEQDAATVLLKQQHTQALKDLETTMKQQHERVHSPCDYIAVNPLGWLYPSQQTQLACFVRKGPTKSVFCERPDERNSEMLFHGA